MNERDKINVCHLRVVAALAEQAAMQLAGNQLWEGELTQTLNKIKTTLELVREQGC